MTWLFGLLKWFSGGPLDRIFDTIDKKVDAETDRAKLKADIIQEHFRTRADYMRSGGLWLMILFAAPLGFWFSAVCVYSVFWCAGCAFPQQWTIAALPPPLDEWSGLIVLSIFGVVGAMRFRK